MGQDDETKPKGFLYRWVNDPRVETKTKTVKRIPCEVYSRIVGYMRPVAQWHDGKKQEFAERQEYVLPEVIE